MSWYQKDKTNLNINEARGSEWQWYQLGHMQVCNSLQTDNHASTPPLSLLQAGCPSCHPTNSVKALKANAHINDKQLITVQGERKMREKCAPSQCVRQPSQQVPGDCQQMNWQHDTAGSTRHRTSDQCQRQQGTVYAILASHKDVGC